MKTFFYMKAAALCIAVMLYGTVLTAQVITTFAGDGTAAFGGDGAAAAAAQLNKPRGIAFDTEGNLYIADADNNRIRKVDAVSGIITTFAGTGAAGFGGDGGPASAALLNKPSGLAFDRSGNLYVCDVVNSRIRHISPSGTITSFAGTGALGYAGDGGPALNARFSSPQGIAIDASDNVYITDAGTNTVRRVDAGTGIITTFAGNGGSGYSGDGGPATAASLTAPHSSCFDAAGNMYIADQFNCVIRKVNTAGEISTFAGTNTCGLSGDGAAAIAANLINPTGVITDASGTLYMTNYNGHVVRSVDPSGIIRRVAGTDFGNGYSGDGAAATSAKLSHPYAIAIGPDDNLYISDVLNNRIRKVTLPACTGADAGTVQSSNGSSFCSNDSTLLTVNAVNTGSGITYLWQSSTDDISWTDAGNRPFLQTGPVSTAIYYRCVVTCTEAAVHDTSASLLLTPLPAVQPAVTITANPGTAIAPGTNVTFTATVVNGGSNPGYQWQRNTTDIPGATTSTYTTNNLSHNTVITCKLYSNAACTEEDSVFSNPLVIQLTTGLGAVSGQDKLLAFPNPNKGILSVAGTVAGTKAVVQIVNIVGQAVYEKEYVLNNGRLQLQLALPAACTDGWYMLRVLGDRTSYHLPFILER